MSIITEKHLKFEITDKRKKERLDLFLVNSIENATRTKIQALIKAGLVTVNGKSSKPGYIINNNDVINVTIPISPRPDKAEPEDIPLDIIYEDNDIIIINKPAGMVVHPAFGNYTGTLVNALLFHSRELSLINNVERAGIIHRIDKDTSGLLVAAKNNIAHSKIARQFSEHSIDREYHAVVWGHLRKKSGMIEGNLGRSTSDRKKFSVVKEGKYAATGYEVLMEYDFLSLLKLKLKTGRTHQIRVHLLSIGHPVFGDPTYGGRRPHNIQLTSSLKQHINNLLEVMKRQALHAKTLGFIHPSTGKHVYFDSPLPEDFTELLKRIESW